MKYDTKVNLRILTITGILVFLGTAIYLLNGGA